MFFEMKRTLSACVLIVALGAGAAMASDFCDPCPPARPMAVKPCPSLLPCVPSSTPASTVSASLPLEPAFDDVSSSVAGYVTPPTGQTPLEIVVFLVPLRDGMLETSLLPESENEVDTYYSTHRVENGRVVAVPPARTPTGR